MLLKFINRERELKTLEDKYKSGKPEFIVMYGRRRVGKTALIKRFIEEKSHFYFLAKKKDLRDEMERFRLKFSKNFNVFVPEAKDWDTLFEGICGVFRGRLVMVIDEFPFWIEKDKSILSDFQHLWDETLKDKKIFLVLCGSYVSVMETDVLGYKSPLYGRRTGQLEVAKLGFVDFIKFFPSWKLEDVIRTYGALDGIPFYIKEFNLGRSFLENVNGTFWKSGSVLNKEAEFLLSQELREVEVYLSIMRSIFEGASKLAEIASKSHVEITNINKYLKVLVNLKFVTTEYPVIVARPKRKNFVYKISDNFFNFWLSYVYPFKDDIEIEETDYLKTFLQKDYDRYLGFVFEAICKQAIPCLRLPLNPTKTGRWWYKDKEIDLVGLNEATQEILFAECKWQERVNAEKVLEELRQKAQFVDWHTDKRKEHYAIFAKSFKRKIKEKGLLLFDLKDLARIFKRH